MYPSSIDTLPLEHCAECQGTVASRETLMKLSPHGAKTMELSADENTYKRPPYFEPRKKPPFLICPLCQKRMKETRLGPMNVELCSACHAMWMDGAKIEHLGELIGPYKWRMAKK